MLMVDANVLIHAFDQREVIWDANLATAAEAAGLLFEDMADGMRIGELEVVNPFAIDGLPKRARAHLAIGCRTIA